MTRPGGGFGFTPGGLSDMDKHVIQFIRIQLKRVFPMDGITIKDILGQLAQRNFRISLPTVRGYIAKALAPKPIRVGGGAGIETVYPEDTAAEVAASYTIIKRYNVRTHDLALSRKIANYIEAHGIVRTDDALKNLVRGKDFESYVAYRWLECKKRFLAEDFQFGQWDLYKLMNIANDDIES